MDKLRDRVAKIIEEYEFKGATRGETYDKIISLTTQKEPVAKLQCSAGLNALAQAWDKASKHYKDQAEKHPSIYNKGTRNGAAYKLESCANELRALMKEMGI